MLIFRKKYIDQIKKYFLEDRKITILIGARRVGKTFLMKQFYDKLKSDSVWISFDEFVGKSFGSVNEFLNFLKIYGGKSDFKYIFLDEIQLIPGISWILKSIYDKNLNYHIICSGSGSFKIFSNLEDSLVGRVKFIPVYTLSFEEFFNFKIGVELKSLYETPILIEKYYYLLEEFLKFGGYPEVVLASNLNDKISILSDLYNFWIDKDIKFLLSGEDILNFKKFFRFVAFRVTSIFKINSLSNELSIKYNKIKQYYDILKASYVIFNISPLTTKYSYEIRSGEKIYFMDVGFLNYILENFNIVNRGELIENFVISEVLKNKLINHKLYFWKKLNQSEIDLIIKDILNNCYYPIEIKSNTLKTIPKVFYSFHNIYQFKKGLVFNSKYLIELKKENFTIKFVPYIFASLYSYILN